MYMFFDAWPFRVALVTGARKRDHRKMLPMLPEASPIDRGRPWPTHQDRPNIKQIFVNG